MEKEAKQTSGPLNIVIVDDESDALNLMAFFLQQMPRVHLQGSYSSGQQAIREIKASPVKPDIIFTDISMPGIDGIELSKKIRKILPEVAFVFITAYNHYAPETTEIKPIGFLQKPIEPSELFHCIKLFIAKAGKYKSPS